MVGKIGDSPETIERKFKATILAFQMKYWLAPEVVRELLLNETERRLKSQDF